MSLPVSSYEELLARVRSLTHETIQLQRELTTPISNSAPSSSLQLDHNENERLVTPLVSVTVGGTDESLSVLAANDIKENTTYEPPPTHELHRPNTFQRPLLSRGDEDRSWSVSHRKFTTGCRERSQTSDMVGSAANVRKPSAGGEGQQKDKEQGPPEPKEQDEHRNDGTQGSEGAANDEGQNIASLYHGTWPVERGLWHSGPTHMGGTTSLNQDACSVMSFSCSVGSCGGGSSQRSYNQQQLGAKVEMVYSLLSMLGTHDREDMSRTLLAMSSSPDSCQAMRQSGCLPLLVQFLHVPDQPAETRLRASQALHNVVHSQADDKRGRREARVLRLLEQVRDYCDSLRNALQTPGQERPSILDDMERHPGPTIAALMKLSFDEEHRHAMCQLGGLHAIAELIQLDHEAHGSTTNDQYCVTLRRYAGMALTNLTFGDGTNKALLCSFLNFMKTLVAQLSSPSEDLRQVTASVLRNLSWRADGASKQMLREVSAVPGLMHAAMEGKKEATLKSILSALWNLSAHCTMNKVDICAVEGALGFLVEMLSYNAPSKTLAIVENAGGILRNISSHIAIREDYRSMLRYHNCLQVLLQQLKSPSLTIVSNACGTLWNLSARCAEDQRALWDMGAVNMLRSLVHSKHKMISMGSSAALKNLLGAKPNNNYPLDSTAKSLGLPALPSLYVRKQKALEQELDHSLAETCDNIEPSTSPSGLRDDKFIFSPTERFNSDGRHRLFRCHYQNQARHKTQVSRSDSRDSVTSTLSDTVYERISRNNAVLSHTLPIDGVIRRDGERSSSVHGILGHTETANLHLPDNVASDKKFLRRYSNAMKQREDRRVLSWEGSDDNVLESSLVHSTEALVSPCSRLDCSDEGYLEKVKESSSDLKGAQKLSKTHKGCSRDTQRNSSYHFSSDPLYQNRPNSSTYPRNKFSDLEIDSGLHEEPVDYSLKYKEQSQAGNKSLESADKVTELKLAGEIKVEDSRSNQNDLGRGYALRNQANVSTSKNIKMNVVYGDYAETDLDQPTDYSLKYAEEDEELEFAKTSEGEEVGEPVQFYEGSSPILEDTLKTYYTEGTPYETPYNFSTATSMSDLRCEQTMFTEKKEDKERYPESVNAENFHEGSTEKEFQTKYLPSVTKPPLHGIRSGLGSGLMSPEKPIQYCEEGTPGLFSRVSSLSSLNSIPVNPDVACSEDAKRPDKDEPKEGKAVTDGHAEETPLMFSRCSSLGSLSSFEQHSIRSSVVSDFSRRTSGMVSPSELPDSPTQSVHAVSSVFRDDTTAFKEEDTPVELSRATSLSSLTVDEEVSKPSKSAGIHHVRRAEREREEGTEKRDVEKEKRDLSDCCELAPVSEGEEDDACITVGMRGGRTMAGACEDALSTYCTEGTPATASHAGSRSDLSVLSFPCDKDETRAEETERPDFSDDSSNFSGDNDNILAECIQSGMPEARTPRRVLLETPPVGKDRVETYATEGSPYAFSTRSSPSDLTVSTEGGAPGMAGCLRRPAGSRPSSEVASCDPSVRLVEEDTPSSPKALDKTNSISEDAVTVLSRDGSSSSSSVDSFGSTEPTASEQALLEQCINSGMPKSREARRNPLERGMARLSLNDGTKGFDAERSSKNGPNPSAVTSGWRPAAADVGTEGSATDVGDTPGWRCVEGSLMKRSTDRDTWNDDSSPNDVSFPSVSFRSLSELAEEPPPCLTTCSSIIRLEAEMMITDMEHSSTDLDAIKPPSMIDSLVSLTASLSECCEVDDRSSMRGRHWKKKAFPAGVMVRRALGNNHNSVDSLLDNVSISGTSQIDNVKPPSAMEELIDLVDMENSMISVASITSEVADLAKESFQSDAPPDVVRSSTSTLRRSSEGTDERVEDTICSDTEICDDPAYTHTIDCEDPAFTHTFDDVDAPELPSDGGRSTPTTSELSSAESTPKKRQKPRLLTPKQKRQLVKDRYRTYTISAEEERQLEKERKLRKARDQSAMCTAATDSGNPQSFDKTNKLKTELTSIKTMDKITPKQRRLEDRSRFQTRVLDKTSKTESSENGIAESTELNRQTDGKNNLSGIPKFGAKKNIKTLKEKRAAAKERFRTRTLSEDVNVTSQGSTRSQQEDVPVQPTPEEVESLLQRDANLVISTLNENRGRSESDDMMLDCETLSLVSIESESEHHSKKQALTQQNSLDMLDDGEEKTYVADPHTPMDDGEDIGEPGDAFKDDGEKESIGPRIWKPSNLSLTLEKSPDVVNTEGEVLAPKCVRGRRKALYSSPVTTTTGRAQTAQTASSGPVRGTRSSNLRQVKLTRVTPVSPTPRTSLKSNKAITKAVNSIMMAPLKPATANSTPVTSKLNTTSKTERTVPETVATEENKEVRFRPPERQGTFTKEDGSTVQCIPLPTSPGKTRIPVPASTPTDSRPKLTASLDKKSASLKTATSVGSRVKVRQDPPQTPRPKTAPNRLAKTLSLDGDASKVAQGSKFVNKRKPVLLRECGWVNKKGELKSSVSSQSLQSRRSISNSSLNSVESTSAAARVRKKEVTSKIASLWKKVEESKHKQKYVQKDTRVWITSESKQEETKETENVPTNLVRSSTFDGASCKIETLQEKLSVTKMPALQPKKKPGVRSSKLTFTTGAKINQNGDNFRGNPEPDVRVAEVTGTVKPKDEPEVVMRCKWSHKVGEPEREETPQQRVSRLGSFFCMEGAEKPSPASAIVSPFNYNPPVPVTPSHIPTLVKVRPDESATEPGQNTASMLVTTV